MRTLLLVTSLLLNQQLIFAQSAYVISDQQTKTVVFENDLAFDNSGEISMEFQIQESVGNTSEIKEDEFCDWTYFHKDKALQYSLKLLKEENDIGYYAIKFRMNINPEVHVSIVQPSQLGYTLTLKYYDPNDLVTPIYHHLVFYKSYNDSEGYTLEQPIRLRHKYSDGSILYLKNTVIGCVFFAKDKNGNEVISPYWLSTCIHQITEKDDENSKYEWLRNRCRGDDWKFDNDISIILK